MPLGQRRILCQVIREPLLPLHKLMTILGCRCDNTHTSEIYIPATRSPVGRLGMRPNSTVRRVAEAVVAVLREPLSHEVRGKLARLRLKEWESSYHWLDANGLALYFRNAIRANHLELYVPCELMTRLDRNHSDNQVRLEHQLAECRIINQRFQLAGIQYANVKGLTLVPDYCPSLLLRYQVDLDFMVRRRDGHSCRMILEDLGYRLTVEEADTLEFKPPEDRLPSITDLYKPRRQQGVEVHFGSPTGKVDLGEDCLARTYSDGGPGFGFPRLSEPDMFFSLVFHVYRHLLSEWIRLSWFYELGFCLQRRASDADFWCAVLARVDSDQDTARALALVLAFSKHAFSSTPLPEGVTEICSKYLSRSPQLWVDNYGPEMLLSDFPGNKLYLLLMREISAEQKNWRAISRKRLVPFHSPARVLYGNSWAEQIRHIPGNTRYGLSRARFHAREGFRYLNEQWRWKRRLAQAALLKSGSK